MNIPYSICCFIKNGCMWLRNTAKCCCRSLNGTMMATLCLAVQLGGLYLPPNCTSGYFFSIVAKSMSVLLACMGPKSVGSSHIGRLLESFLLVLLISVVSLFKLSINLFKRMELCVDCDCSIITLLPIVWLLCILWFL
ncbi:unnamed protein product [Spodoptera exigua]|nr:unnamed protein product [Spodoptera exigua]